MEITVCISPFLGFLYTLFVASLAAALVAALCEPERDERKRGPWGRR